MEPTLAGLMLLSIYGIVLLIVRGITYMNGSFDAQGRCKYLDAESKCVWNDNCFCWEAYIQNQEAKNAANDSVNAYCGLDNEPTSPAEAEEMKGLVTMQEHLQKNKAKPTTSLAFDTIKPENIPHADIAQVADEDEQFPGFSKLGG